MAHHHRDRVKNIYLSFVEFPIVALESVGTNTKLRSPNCVSVFSPSGIKRTDNECDRDSIGGKLC